MERQLLSQCRFCAGFNNLIKICDCYTNLNEAHINCLINHINFTRNPYCTTCGSKYKGIIVKISGVGFCRWIKTSLTARYDVFVLPIIVLFFFLIAYIGYIQYITSYWHHPFILRFFLNHVCNIIFITSFLGLILVIFKGGADFWRWRRENAIITTLPIQQVTSDINTNWSFLRNYRNFESVF